ncbi:MAG: lipopolysaccharide transport periplasmic protein LptA [Gammaproteobacteria bacterium]
MNLKNPEWLALLLALLLTPAWALESDRLQPLKIVADSATLDEKDGTATYQGNVVLTQGSLKISAQRLHISTEQGKVNLVSAEGKPAQFSQQPAANQPAVTATALTIDYQVKDQTLVLRRKASVVQNENVFKGEEITYEIQSQRLRAEGQSKDTPKGEPGTGRVEMILPSAADIAPKDTTPPAEEPAKTAP